MDHSGQVSVLTGAAGGIGRGLASRLSTAPGTVVIVDRDEARLADLAGDLESATATVRSAALDVTDRVAIKNLVEDLRRDHGRIDIVVNNAGTSAHGPLAEVSQATWDQEIAVHMTAPFQLIQEVAPIMRQRGYGRIVNISSVAALMGPIDLSPYGAAKSGLLGINRAAAVELAVHGITVNSLALGPIATDLLRKTWPAEQLAARAEHLPMRRLGEVEDVVNAVMFLVSPSSGFITGTVLPVDGGSVAAGAYMVEQYRRWHADE